MKMGFITSLLDGWTYEEMIDEVSRLGIECVEVACWPQGKAERKYAGVSHIDVERVLADDAYAAHVLDYAAQKSVRICALAYCASARSRTTPTTSTPTPSAAAPSTTTSLPASTPRPSSACPR